MLKMPTTKLTEEDVLLIRSCWHEREQALQQVKDTNCYSMKSLAEKFDTAKSNIEKIVNGYTWKDV